MLKLTNNTPLVLLPVGLFLSNKPQVIFNKNNDYNYSIFCFLKFDMSIIYCIMNAGGGTLEEIKYYNTK